MTYVQGHLRSMANFSSETMEARRYEKTFSECWKKNNIVKKKKRVLYVAKLIFNKKGKIKTLAGKKNTKSLAGMLLRYIKVNLQAEMKGQ